MAITISSELSWAFIITCVTTTILVQARDPKSEVEAVPGIIYPSVPNQICMLRKGYECRWTIEKSCSCNLTQKRPLWRTLEISFIRKRLKKGRKVPVMETHECQTTGDRCIQMS
ncbi:uncharacterized protein LOC100679500 [Nasonia vitripennis]|uniref:Uncharacterized protein n=1 Tax=Nasonia vitripennis TaxID=7425 RepID=A0A7M7IXF3_NASVI|nr:uncharacterized protein LOC100679500 [Nasonia vitripennis]XP_016845213.1 uncharacterized protein LOC100679500 [Nasonia vitripennis]